MVRDCLRASANAASSARTMSVPAPPGVSSRGARAKTEPGVMFAHACARCCASPPSTSRSCRLSARRAAASLGAPRASRALVPARRPRGRRASRAVGRVATRALFDPDTVDDPLLRKAMKEPVAFFGGVFAGLLGLSVDEPGSPLTAWVDSTAAAAGVRVEDQRVVDEHTPETNEATDAKEPLVQETPPEA